ncbi:hypothetical protein [Staphylococcus hominis]|nr:hypothetical protein [Staphylococcus hominis]
MPPHIQTMMLEHFEHRLPAALKRCEEIEREARENEKQKVKQ